MYYHTPKISNYLRFIVTYRIAIIFFFTLIVSLCAFLYHPKILSSSELFWLKNSVEFQKTQEQNYQIANLSKLTVQVNDLNASTLNKLKALHKQLLKFESVNNCEPYCNKNYLPCRK